MWADSSRRRALAAALVPPALPPTIMMRVRRLMDVIFPPLMAVIRSTGRHNPHDERPVLPLRTGPIGLVRSSMRTLE